MSVFAWGGNNHGALGIGAEDKLKQNTPILLESLRATRILSVACGDAHNLAVTELGDVWVWGRGKEGQHGDGEQRVFVNMPQRVWALRAERVVQVACGHFHCLALTNNGQVYQWGRLYRFVDQGKQAYFSRTISLTGMEKDRRSKMLERSRDAYYSGDMDEEEIRQSNQLTNFGAFSPYVQNTPALVESLLDKKVVGVFGGYSYSFFTTDTGQCYSYGYNDRCQLGLGHRYNQDQPSLVRFPDTPDGRQPHIVAVACGEQHTLELDSEGRVYSHGGNVFGQLGHGNTRSCSRPKLIQSLVDQSVKAVAIDCGSHHSVVVAEDGSVWTFGCAEYGQLGGLTEYSDWSGGNSAVGGVQEAFNIPRRMPQFDKMDPPRKIQSICCGHLFNLVRTQFDEILSYGWNAGGNLGTGTKRAYQLVPTAVDVLRGEPISSIAAGARHSVAVSNTALTGFAFDFKVDLEHETLADITFEVRGRKLPAHKVVVFSRCPYLRSAMLMTERFCRTKLNSHAMENVQFHTVKALLTYLYTDQLKCPDHLIGELGRLARLYRLPRLSYLCSAHGKMGTPSKSNSKQATTKKEIHASSASSSSSSVSERNTLIRMREQMKQDRELGASQFCTDLSSMVNNPSFADVVFHVSELDLDELAIPIPPSSFHASSSSCTDQKIKSNSTSSISSSCDPCTMYAHKVVLISRCEYFRTIFQSGFLEQSTGVIPITGMRPAIFEMILRYIYTGDDSMSKDPDFAVEILFAADRFLLGSLKQMCEIFLEQSLDVDNAASLLVISDQCSAPRLKVACLSMIRFSWEEVRESAAYREFVTDAPESLCWDLDDYLSAKQVIEHGTVADARGAKGKGEASQIPSTSTAGSASSASLVAVPMAASAAMLSGGGSSIPLAYNTSWNRT